MVKTSKYRRKPRQFVRQCEDIPGWIAFFFSTTAWISSLLGPFGPGFFRDADENNSRYFRLTRVRCRCSRVDGFTTTAERIRRAGTQEQRTQSSDEPVRDEQIRCAAARPIQNQQLVFEQNRFGDYGTQTSRTGESNNSGDQMDE